MSYQLDVIRTGDYLHIKVSGENSAEAVAGYLHDGLALSQNTGCPFILVEDGLTGPDLDLEVVFEITSQASAAAQSAVKKVAFVKTTPGHDRSLVRFAENLAANRAVDLRVFPTIAAAEQWITHHSRDGKA